MAGIFKNLDASDIRLTPFRSHKKWNSTVCYENYYSNVQANPESIGLLTNQSTRLYASDASSSRILKLNQSDNYEVLADEVITNLTSSEYGQDFSRGYVASYGTNDLTMSDGDLQVAAGGVYASTEVDHIKDISYAVSASSTSSFMITTGEGGISGKEFSTFDGNFVGSEFTPSNVLDEITGSFIAVSAEGKLNNDKIVALVSSGSLGVFTIAFTGSWTDPLHAQSSASVSPGSAYGYTTYGASVYGETTPATLKTFLYCGTQDLYFALFDDGYLFKIEPDTTSTLVGGGIAEILQDKSNFVSGSTDYQTSKIHVVYNNGRVGLDLVATNTGYNIASYDRVIEAGQYVAQKPIVKATIQQNESPALIGIFTGTTSSLAESVFFTIDPDTGNIGNPCHFGATKGDMRIGVANQEAGEAIDVFIGYNSIYSNRFIEMSCTEEVFQLYKADYNPTPTHASYDPLNTWFDQGNYMFDRYQAATWQGKLQRVVHKSLNHLFYESFYDNTKACFGNGNINNQIRFLEDQAYVLDLPQTKFGEAIQPQSITINANYNISGSQQTSVVIKDDSFGNLYVSGGMVSPIDATVLVTESVTTNTAGEWPTKDLYKYNGKGAQSFTSSFNRGNWQMQTAYKDIIFTEITGSEIPIPSPIDLLGVAPTFSSQLSSSIHITPSAVQDYRTSFNFENGDFTISFMVRPTDTSTHESGSVILAKQGIGEDYGLDINGNVLSYPVTSKSPWRISMNSSYEVLFERDNIFQVATASGSLTQNQLHHVVAMKSGSNLYMYVDNVLTQTAPDVALNKACSNKSDIWIGNVPTPTLATNNQDQVFERGFDGMIDNIKIYPTALAESERSILYHTLGRGTTIVGNAFYNQGMLVLGSITSRYLDIENTTARGTHTIWEKEFTCTVGAGEFNRTMNPTVREYNPISNQYEFKSYTTGSDFKPYVTGIGLYDEFGDLLAVAKLGFPTKLPNNVDTTFIVRYDK